MIHPVRHILMIAVFGMASIPLTAQTFTWDGGSAFNSSWATAANWTTSAPVSGINTRIQFGGTTRLDPNQNIATPFVLNRMDFLTGGGAFIVSGNQLDFQNSSAAEFFEPTIFHSSNQIAQITTPVRLSAATTVNMSSSGDLVIGGGLSGPGALTMATTTNGTLTLGGSNTGWTGSLNVTSGTLTLNGNQALNGNAVVISRPGRLTVTNLGTNTIGDLSFRNDLSTSTNVSPLVTGALLRLGGNVSYTPAASGLNFQALLANDLQLTGNRTFNIAGGSPDSGGLTTQGSISGGFGVTKTGTGTWRAESGSWTFTGATNVNQGILVTAAADVLSPSSAVVLSASGRLNLAGFNQQIGSLSGASGNYVELLGATLTLGSNNTNTTYAGVIGSITSFYSGRVVKVGTGTLTLTNTNLFSGGLEVQRGVVAVTQDASLGGPGFGVTVKPAGQVRFTANTNSSGRTFDLTTGGSMTVDAGQSVTYDGTTILGGFLRGSGAHVLISGTFVSGATVLSGSTVNINGAGTDPTLQNVVSGGSTTVSSGAGLNWDGGSLTSAGRLTVNNAAVVNTTSFDSTGQMNILPGGTLNHSGGALVLGGGSVTNVGTYNPTTGAVTAGGTINLGANNIEVRGGLLRNNGAIVTTGNLIVDFGGVARGAGDYDVGGTQLLNGGVFLAGNSPGLSRNSNLSVSGPSMVGGDLNNATGTVGGFAAAQNGNTTNSGWSAIEFGNSANTASGLTLQRTASGAARWQFRTTLNDGIGNTEGAAANFDPTQSYTWQIFRPRTNASESNPNPTLASDQLNTVATITLLDSNGNVLANTNSNLNLVLEFDRMKFINPLTGAPILSSVGTFQFIFGPDLIGRSNTTIALQYTPVPEPGLALAAVGIIGLIGAWRRRRR